MRVTAVRWVKVVRAVVGNARQHQRRHDLRIALGRRRLSAAMVKHNVLVHQYRQAKPPQLDNLTFAPSKFIAAGEKVLGTKIEILSGKKEAELAAHGIRMGFVAPDGVAGDLGGGSLELIDIHADKLNQAATLALGGLRLIDETGDRLEKASDIVDDRIASLDWLQKGRGRTFFAVGGTWRAESGFIHLHVPPREAVRSAQCPILKKSNNASRPRSKRGRRMLPPRSYTT